MMDLLNLESPLYNLESNHNEMEERYEKNN